MKIKNIEKRGNRKEGVNLIIEVLEKDVIPKGNRKLLNRRNFYKQHLTSLGFSHVRGKYVIQLDDENEIETMKTLLESYRTKYQSYPNSYLRSGDYRKKFFDKNRPIFKDYYICAYCGRFLKKKDVTVDHIISIRKAQKSKILQFILRLVKINDINDEKNLTASCETCNKKKGQKLSLSYVLRGILGRKSWEGTEKSYEINTEEIDPLDLPKPGTFIRCNKEKAQNYLLQLETNSE